MGNLLRSDNELSYARHPKGEKAARIDPVGFFLGMPLSLGDEYSECCLFSVKMLMLLTGCSHLDELQSQGERGAGLDPP